MPHLAPPPPLGSRDPPVDLSRLARRGIEDGGGGVAEGRRDGEPLRLEAKEHEARRDAKVANDDAIAAVEEARPAELPRPIHAVRVHTIQCPGLRNSWTSLCLYHRDDQPLKMRLVLGRTPNSNFPGLTLQLGRTRKRAAQSCGCHRGDVAGTAALG